MHWPGTTDLTCVHRGSQNYDIWYTATYKGEKVSIKKIYSEEPIYDNYSKWVRFAEFANFMNDNGVSTANYVSPNVVKERVNERSMAVSMQHIPEGFSNAMEAVEYQPFAWINDENSARALGEYFGKFRTQSIAYAAEYTDSYNAFDDWKGGHNSW
jgi:hypothetical protein